MENEPDDVLEITVSGEPFEINRYNTSLFTFIGELALKDHVFLVLKDDENGVEGTYIWEYFQEDAYVALAGFIIEHDFPQHLNATQMAQCDDDAWENAIKANLSDINDFIPEDFENGKDTTD